MRFWRWWNLTRALTAYRGGKFFFWFDRITRTYLISLSLHLAASFNKASETNLWRQSKNPIPPSLPLALSLSSESTFDSVAVDTQSTRWKAVANQKDMGWNARHHLLCKSWCEIDFGFGFFLTAERNQKKSIYLLTQFYIVKAPIFNEWKNHRVASTDLAKFHRIPEMEESRWKGVPLFSRTRHLSSSRGVPRNRVVLIKSFLTSQTIFDNYPLV